MIGKIVEVKFTTASNGKQMLRCTLESGEAVNIFSGQGYGNRPDQFQMLADAGYRELTQLADGQITCWTQYPIRIEMQQNGKWLNLIGVYKREPGAEQDPDNAPDPVLYYMRAKARAHHLICADIPVVYFDFETTGTGPDAEIVSATIIGGVDRKTLLNTFIKPRHPERLDVKINGVSAGEINGITQADLEDADPFVEVYPTLLRYMDGAIWVAYNASFDARMIEQDCIRRDLVPPAPLAIVDAMEIFAEYNGEWSPIYRKFVSKKLTEACEIASIIMGEAHTSSADTQAMVDLIERIAL